MLSHFNPVQAVPSYYLLKKDIYEMDDREIVFRFQARLKIFISPDYSGWLWSLPKGKGTGTCIWALTCNCCCSWYCIGLYIHSGTFFLNSHKYIFVFTNLTRKVIITINRFYTSALFCSNKLRYRNKKCIQIFQLLYALRIIGYDTEV